MGGLYKKAKAPEIQKWAFLLIFFHRGHTIYVFVCMCETEREKEVEREREREGWGCRRKKPKTSGRNGYIFRSCLYCVPEI